jgi:HSP20 family protein
VTDAESERPGKQHAGDIFSRFEHIQRRMDQAYDRILGPPGASRFGPTYLEPSVDIYETDDEIVVLVEVAGIPEAQIEIEVDGTTLTFRGERKPLGGRPKRSYVQMEISHGRFQRELELPSAVNVEEASAVYSDGILEITLPKASPVANRHLRIVVR